MYNNWQDKLSLGPLPKAKGVEQKTATLKNKRVTDKHLRSLFDELRSRAKTDDNPSFLLKYVSWSLTFFVRPSEWASATTGPSTAPDGTQQTLVRFKNAKATNAQGHGEFRFFTLKLKPNQLNDFLGFIDAYQDQCSTIGAAVFQERLRQQLANACRAAKVPILSLYSLRHIGMAHAKGELLDIEVSYAAGHRSDRTKTVHYAPTKKSPSLWVSSKAAFQIEASDAAKVRATGRSRKRPVSVNNAGPHP